MSEWLAERREYYRKTGKMLPPISNDKLISLVASGDRSAQLVFNKRFPNPDRCSCCNQKILEGDE